MGAGNGPTAPGIGVLVSGSGSNLQAILDAAAAGSIPAPVRLVVSNRPEAYALQRAAEAGVEGRVIQHHDYPDRETFDTAVAEALEDAGVDLVVLAGFMRILSEGFVRRFEGRLLNIHPSLLPLYRGLHTHRRALEAGDREHGCTVHFVTPELDAGPSIIQARVPIEPDDGPDTLARRVLTQEHRIYPLAVRWFVQGRLELRGGIPHLDGQPLLEPVTIRPDDPLPH